MSRLFGWLTVRLVAATFALYPALALAGEQAAEKGLGMTIGGWAMLIISWSAITALAIFCFRLLFTNKD